MIAVLLALAAAALLAVGHLADVTAFAWAAFGVAGTAAFLVVLPRFNRTPSVREQGLDTETKPAVELDVVPAVEEVPEPDPEPETSDPDLVLVIPGRRRFHRPACELLGDHPAEQLTEEEAREEEFTACTRCVR